MIATIIILSFALSAALAWIVVLNGKTARLDERLRHADETIAAKDYELKKQQADFDRINADAERKFAEIASRTLSANAEAIRRQNNQGIAEMLQPMKEDLAAFRQTIADSYSREARERFSLGERVRELIDLNQAIGHETRRLTDALKGNSRFQGDWGEMILANILEAAGFREGYEYHVQKSVTDSEGHRQRPDVVISYADDRNIIIDSKVSIQDYFEMLRADDDASRARFAKAHVASVKKHIAELRDKDYQSSYPGRNFDYALMFIPHEGAFLAAMNIDAGLWEAALAARVLILAPTHLMAVIKLIEQMWRQDKQNKNALAIAEEAGRMLDKLQGFMKDMEDVDRALNGARNAYSSAYAKLATAPGNLIGKARKLQELGAKAKRPLPEA